jgi:hypothetical protein
MRLFGFCLLSVFLGFTLAANQVMSLFVIPLMFVYWIVFGLESS